MPRYQLSHRHTPAECRVVFAAWAGVVSPLRHVATLGSCPVGNHQLWWTVKAPNVDAALALLPPFVAARTEATEVTDVPIP